MSDTLKRISDLSPAKRRRLEQILKERIDQTEHLQTIPRRDRAKGWPSLSFHQARLWFLDQLEPNSPLYNLGSAVRLTGSLNLDALKKALNEIVRRHEILRTSFDTVEGRLVQLIAPELSLDIQLLDFRTTPEAEREAQATRLAVEKGRQPFNLSQAPLMRVDLLRLGDEDYLALLTMHHIISDGWSLGVFLKELAALYEAFSAGRKSPLPELPIQYADYAEWQIELLRDEVYERQLSYWKQQLGDGSPLLQLPTDRPRPAIQTYEGAIQSRTMPKGLLEGLKALSLKHNATFYMTMVAAYHVLLHRYSGQDDISIGSPIAGRNYAETEGLIGFFINTLVLRADLSGDPTFMELLKRVREVTLGAYAHQSMPFEKLVDAIQPERNMSHSPLFQVWFVLQNTPLPPLKMPALTMEPVGIPRGTAKFDLTLSVVETDLGLTESIEYSTDLFDSRSISRMTEHYERLLESIVENPHRKISQLEMLTDSELQELLFEWNGSRQQTLSHCIHQVFQSQASRYPESIAVVMDDQQLTFEDLNRQANQLAHYLRSLGVGPETLVGVCLQRCTDVVVSLMAIFKAGGAYLPLDPEHPEERLAYMISDSGVEVVITEQWLIPGLPAEIAAGEVVCLDTDSYLISQESTDDPHVNTDADNLAYVIYTSGSTGKPRGVSISHKAAVNHLLAVGQAFGLSRKDRVLEFASLSFDVSLEQMLAPLLCGASVAMRGPDIWSTSEFWEKVSQQQVTVINPPTAYFHQLAREQVGGRGIDTQRVKLVIVGGDALQAEAVRHWQKRGIRACRLVNAYGPTEATITSNVYQVRAGWDDGARVPIGRAVGARTEYIVGRLGELVPVGALGELHIGGELIARGYLGNAEETAERFIPDRYSEEPGRRLYRTGDICRYRADGEIEFVGREDDQVKVRGFRIELGEIESALSRHPSIKEAVVVAHEDSGGEKTPVAYLVAAGSEQVTSSEVRGYLKQRLPEYMVPSAYVFMEEMPLNSNGKIDRKALQEPGVTREQEETYIAPRNPTEVALAETWTEVLNVDRVGMQDNFFELGGHSLLATQLVSRVRELFQVELPLRDFFETPTIAGLAEIIEASLGADRRVEVEPILPIQRDGELPLSFAQQRLWFLCELEPGSAFYNTPIAIRLTGQLEVTALGRSLNEIVRRHEVLRTTFAVVDGSPVQVIAPFMSLSFPMVDLCNLPVAEREIEVERLAGDEARQPFDLTKGPLLRSSLLRLGDDEHVALFTMHHIVSDGWSLGVLTKEVAALYEAFVTGAPSPLSELPIQYADYAHWQREWLQGDVSESQLSYWKQQLAGAPPMLELPTDRPRSALQNFRGAAATLTLSTELTESLKSLSIQEGTTLFMTLLAVFKALLYRYTNQDDIVVGTPIAGRNRRETEGLIGFLVNTLVLRTELSRELTFKQLLAKVRDVTLGAYAHQDLPFEQLVEELQPKRSLSLSPLFQVMFILQNAPTSTLSLPGLTLTPLNTETETSKFDMILSMNEAGEGLTASLQYNTDLFNADTIGCMLGHFQTLLESIVSDPGQEIGTLVSNIPIQNLRIAVTSTFTADPLEDSLRFWMEFLRIPASIKFAPYAQVFQQLLDPSSALAANDEGINVILLRLEDWAQSPSHSQADVPSTLESNVDEFLMALETLRSHNAAPCLILLCPPSDAALANAKEAETIRNQHRRMVEQVESAGGLFAIDLSDVIGLYRLEKVNDSHSDELGHVPYAPEFFSVIGTSIARKIVTLKSPAYKAIFLDCDQTLWRGVCGEDGPANVEPTAPFIALQKFMTRQYEAGMLICLCGKSNEADVFDAFKLHPEMPLKLRQLVSWRINWEPASTNIGSLASELRVSTDEIIYISGNPVECSEILAICPDVLTLSLPADRSEIPAFLDHIWAFDLEANSYWRGSANKSAAEAAASKALSFEFSA